MAIAPREARASSAVNQKKLQIDDRSILVPEKLSSERWIALLLFFSTCAYLFLFRRYTDMDPDEGIVLAGAQRILKGEVLYRDFFSFFTPGSYYFLALLFKVFGSSFLVARTALVFFGGIFSVVTYLLARRVCSRGSALAVAGLMTMTSLPYRFLVLHNWDSTLWACLGLYCAVRWVENSKTEKGKAKSEKGPIFEFRISSFASFLWPLAAGSFVSLTCLFEQSKGAGLILGLGGGLLAVALLDRRRNLFRKAPLAGLTGGLSWPFLVTLVYFGAQHSLSSMLADWFWPLQHYSGANRVLYGYQNWSESAVHSLFGSGPWFERFVTILAISPCLLVPVLPLAACGLGVYWVSRMWRHGTPEAKCAYYVLTCGVLSGLLLSVVAVRADIVHFMYLQPLFCLVLAWIVDGRDIPGPVFRRASPFLNAYLAFAFLGLAMPLLLRNVNAPYKLETRRGVITMPGKDTVVDFVQAHVAPGEKILVYPYLPLYYYLTGTFSPTRYEYFQPGMHTRGQARELASQLASERARVVLFEISFADKIPTSWPGTPLSAIAADPVADYILANYHTCAVVKSPRGWRFLFMLRKDLACPS